MSSPRDHERERSPPDGPASDAPRDGDVETARFAVPEMDCASCAGKVEAALDAAEGVADRDAVPATGRVTVSYDPGVASVSDLVDAIDGAGSELNAVRLRTRASMGNCQGAFCCYRMANELVPEYDEVVARDALDDLYQERWKGERHALWGQQLSQAMLKHMLHATTMNRDADPATTDEPVDFEAFDAGPDASAGSDVPTGGAGTADDAVADGGTGIEAASDPDHDGSSSLGGSDADL